MHSGVPWLLTMLLLTTIFAGCIDNSTTDVEENNDVRNVVFAACSGAL